MKNKAFCGVLALVASVFMQPEASAQTAPAGVAEIQARHDRAFISELAQYLKQNPKAVDRDQAYAALFNKAIEHDWFVDVEELAGQYLKSDPDGPVKALRRSSRRCPVLMPGSSILRWLGSAN